MECMSQRWPMCLWRWDILFLSLSFLVSFVSLLNSFHSHPISHISFVNVIQFVGNVADNKTCWGNVNTVRKNNCTKVSSSSSSSSSITWFRFCLFSLCGIGLVGSRKSNDDISVREYVSIYYYRLNKRRLQKEKLLEHLFKLCSQLPDNLSEIVNVWRECRTFFHK
jgi:hypothetical protein